MRLRPKATLLRKKTRERKSIGEQLISPGRKQHSRDFEDTLEMLTSTSSLREAACFVIHGLSGSGHKEMSTRLVKKIEETAVEIKSCRIDIRPDWRRKDVQALIELIGLELNFEGLNTLELLAAQLKILLETSDVVFEFADLQRLEGSLPKFVEEFWKPLINELPQFISDPEHYEFSSRLSHTPESSEQETDSPPTETNAGNMEFGFGKIFISHSSKDKTVAEKVADSFKGVADVRLDFNNSFHSQNIQSTTDDAIGQMDCLVLLWSANSAASDDVRQEIAFARKSGVVIIPCLLDETPLDSNPDLRGLPGIDFRDEKIGLLRLQIFAFRKLSNATGDVDVAALNDLKSYEAVMDYIIQHRLSGEDGAGWAMKLLESTNQSYESLSGAKVRVEELLELMKSSIAEIEDAGNDVARLQILLDKLKQHEHRDTKQIKMVIEFIEGQIGSLPGSNISNYRF